MCGVAVLKLLPISIKLSSREAVHLYQGRTANRHDHQPRCPHFEPLISGRKECCETTEFCQSPCTNKHSLSRAFDPANNLEQRCSLARRRSEGKKFGRFFAPLPNVAPFPFVSTALSAPALKKFGRFFAPLPNVAPFPFVSTGLCETEDCTFGHSDWRFLPSAARFLITSTNRDFRASFSQEIMILSFVAVFPYLLRNIVHGLATFADQVIITNVANAYSVFAADLDNDGFLDVLSTSYGDAKIAWYKNMGDGTISIEQRVITTSAAGASSVFAADLDNDGYLDVLSTSVDDDKIAWYKNMGDGTISSEQRVITTSATEASSVFAADLDNDGYLDVLSASANDDKIAWYKNMGDGTISIEQRVITTSAAGASSVFAADLDNDGYLDVLSASVDDDKIAWYKNMGDGTISSEQRVITTSAAGASSVFAADLDNDGYLDVLSASVDDDKIAWYKNMGDGTISSEERVITTSAAEASSVFAADLDNDGYLDVLSASAYDYQIAWYKNMGDGTISIEQQVITTSADGASSVFAADLDNDGYLDVLSASYDDAKIAWYKNMGDGTVGSEERVITTSAADAYSVFAADLDNDGYLDVLSASYGDDKIAWYKNMGDGTVSSEQRVITTSADGASSVFAADLDNDGYLDVLSASFSDDKIAWYKNMGDGTISSEQRVITTSADYATSVFAADLDNDGYLDVLSASYDDAKIAWYKNMGDGTISSEQRVITTNADGANMVFAADLDNDGFLDVLSASFEDDKIAWYKNMGDGTISSEQRVITTSADGAGSVFAADLDNDGFLDVLSASYVFNKIAWYKNMGDGTISSEQRVITTSADVISSVFAADLDNDGFLDVLSASYDKIAWYKNMGDGTISSEQQVITTNAVGASSVFAADLDNDGFLDVLSASVEDDKIAWFANKNVNVRVDFLPSFRTYHQDASLDCVFFEVYQVDLMSSLLSGNVFALSEWGFRPALVGVGSSSSASEAIRAPEVEFPLSSHSRFGIRVYYWLKLSPPNKNVTVTVDMRSPNSAKLFINGAMVSFLGPSGGSVTASVSLHKVRNKVVLLARAFTDTAVDFLDCMTAMFGNSSLNAKTVTFNGAYSCPATVDKTNWTVNITQANTTATVMRTDSLDGWEIDLLVQCCKDAVLSLAALDCNASNCGPLSKTGPSGLDLALETRLYGTGGEN
eukprot:g61881.t1